VAVQELPPKPKTITTDRAATSAAGGAPPTMARADDNASTAIMPKVRGRKVAIVTFLLRRQRSH
jgi:hypothetical protein